MELYDITADQQHNKRKAIERTKFAINQTQNISKGLFYIFRWVWALTVSGKRWQIIIATIVLMTICLPIAFVVDIVLILLYLSWNGFKTVIKSLWKLIVKLFEKFMTKLVYPTIAFFLKIATVIALVIILIYKFDYIKNLIINFFEYLIK